MDKLIYFVTKLKIDYYPSLSMSNQIKMCSVCVSLIIYWLAYHKWFVIIPKTKKSNEFQFFTLSHDKLFISVDPEVEYMFHLTAELFVSSLQIKSSIKICTIFFKFLVSCISVLKRVVHFSVRSCTHCSGTTGVL
jgi:hypothetical protein